MTAGRVIRWSTALAVLGVAAVAAWPAVALVGSYELLMMVIRTSQVPGDDMPETARQADPLQEKAAELFAELLTADRVPSVRVIRAQLHVGQPRAQRLREYLAAVAGTPVGAMRDGRRRYQRLCEVLTNTSLPGCRSARFGRA